MADAPERTRWAAEFESIGRAKVRSEVMLGRWAPEKRTYARQWLERQDVEEWQARADAGAGSSGGLSRLRVNRRVLGLVSGLIFGGFALFRVLRQFKVGF
jgi:hypothetical protein